MLRQEVIGRSGRAGRVSIVSLSVLSLLGVAALLSTLLGLFYYAGEARQPGARAARS